MPKIIARVSSIYDVFQICDNIVPDEYGCFPYPKGTPKYPYQEKINGKAVYVSRIILERKLGRPIKPGSYACHTCDYKSCINPDHLYEGDRISNGQDRSERNQESWDWARTEENREYHRILIKEVNPVRYRWNKKNEVKIK
jgi:hypothetical protein